jgi:glycosyltransferase involved in cell wall biosynthesis
MKITVVTPSYEGESYLQRYVDCMEKNRAALKAADHELEVVIVNDSPWKKIEPANVEDQYIKVVTNSENKGIHYSRVAGLAEATGDYVMFLDQDDLITDDALLKLGQALEKAGTDLIIANANLEQADGSFLQWYRTAAHWDLVWDLRTYLKVGIQIISPGQCLIKRDAIPEFWKEHLVRVNGADDYYLWLLMMAKSLKAGILKEATYIHKHTGENLSADTTATDASVYDFLELLHDCDYFTMDDIITLQEMITYKAQFRTSNLLGKIGCSLANLDTFIANLKFKRVTKTGLGFNR